MKTKSRVAPPHLEQELDLGCLQRTRSSRSMLTLGGRSHDKVHTSPLVGSIKRTKRQTEGMDEQEKRKVTLVVEVMKMLVEERRHSAIRY